MTRRRVAIALYAVAFLFMGIMCIRRILTHATDFDGFWRAGRAVLEHRDIYAEKTGSVDALGEEIDDSAVRRYLPFFSIFMAPLALLPMKVAAGLWHVISFAAFLGALRAALRLSGRPRGLDSDAALFAALASAVFWIDSMTMGQVGLVTLWLSLEGVDLAGRGHPILGGALAGLATAIKVTPGIVGIYFLLKRRWLAAAGMAGAFGLTVLAGAPVWGVRHTVELHDRWIDEARSTSGAEFFERRGSIRYQNLSLHALLARLLMDVNAGRGRKPFQVNVVSWPPGRVAGVAVAAQAAILLAMFLACFARRNGERLRMSEASLVLAATTFLSPIAWTFHLVVLLPGYLRLWDDRADPGTRRWLGLALALELGVAWSRTRALGCLTWACLAAFIGLCRIAMRERREEQAADRRAVPAAEPRR